MNQEQKEESIELVESMVDGTLSKITTKKQ